MLHITDKRIVRSKMALKQSFLSLLENKKFKHITITEIVEKANYNRGTFYAHFESKEDLLQEIIQDVLKEMIHQIKVPYQTMNKVNMRDLPIEDITLFSYFKENERLFKILLSNHIQIDFRYQIAKAIEELFIKEYEYVLEQETELDLKWLYIYRAHGIAGMIIRWIEEDFSTSPKYMSKQVVELMLTSTDKFIVK